ncbi:hypothetical protein ACET3X_004713 [Alternaria dauci]|uniref:Uncharacterized protein n=1 Tax=Alternaria dauci TaxID=48095 RepID=A0ABR3UI72_9PLEO
MCCFRRKPSSSAENRQRTTLFAPRARMRYPGADHGEDGRPPHHHMHLEAGWDKEFESFAERRGQAVPSSPDTRPTPRRIAKLDAVERVHGTQYRNAKPEPRHHVAPFPPNPPNADNSSGPETTTTLSKR